MGHGKNNVCDLLLVLICGSVEFLLGLFHSGTGQFISLGEQLEEKVVVGLLYHLDSLHHLWVGPKYVLNCLQSIFKFSKNDDQYQNYHSKFCIY